MEYKCLCFNKNCQKTFHENFKKRFVNTYIFSYNDIKKIILLLQKGMNTWMNGKNSLPEKEDFYSHLYMEDITDAGYTH